MYHRSVDETAAPGRRRRLELGFLSFVPEGTGSGGSGGSGGAAQGLQDGLRLFSLAEDLGYDSGWVRKRTFEPYLASPMTFFAAVAQRTSRIRLGTGVIPMRYESPVRLAEDATTVDLLSGGRLELGLSSGIAPTAAVLDGVLGGSDRSFAEEAQARIAQFRTAVSGEPLGVAGAPMMSVPAGGDLLLHPASPGLGDRLWYGAGSRATAERTGAQGLGLQVSTLNTEETGEPFDVAQAHQVRAYRKAFADSPSPSALGPRVSAGRIVLPLLSDDDREQHRAFLEGYRSRMDPDGRPLDDAMGFPVRFSPVLAGDPDTIVEALLADEVLGEVDTLVITLPAPGSPESHRRVLQAVATHVAPHLGWTPAA